MKNISLHAVAAASLAVLAAVGASSGPSSAAPRTACEVLPASLASSIIGQAVTTRALPSPLPNGSSLCYYTAGGRKIVQVALTVMQTEAVAARQFQMQQQTASRHPNAVARQKGNIVLSAITMNGDNSKLGALLDAAAKNL
jgi:hypothetical protein